jgi:hypothetical protein
MSALLVMVVASLSTGAVFDIATIALDSDDTRIFIAHCDGDDRADIFFSDKDALHWFGTVAGRGSIPFEEDTYFFDIANVNGDGLNEVITLSGGRVLQYALAGKGDEAQELFEFDMRSWTPLSHPLPRVLAVPYENEIVLALPGIDGIALHRIDGSAIPLEEPEENVADAVRYRAPFSAWTSHRSLVGPADSLEGYVSFMEDGSLPEALQTSDDVPSPAPGRARTPTRARDAVQLEYAHWPWFPLSESEAEGVRVLHALTEPDYANTVIRLHDRPAAENADQGFAREVGPARTYRGRIITHSSTADFNGDGYADLLLWSAPDPAVAWQRASRALTAGTWPVRLTTHLFSVEKGRYEPRPTSVIEEDGPVSWFLNLEAGVPLRSLTLADFNGDGRTDMGFAVDETTYHVRLRGEISFDRNPDEIIETTAPIEELAFLADLDKTGAYSLGLRAGGRLHVCRPIRGLTSP